MKLLNIWGISGKLWKIQGKIKKISGDVQYRATGRPGIQTKHVCSPLVESDGTSLWSECECNEP